MLLHPYSVRLSTLCGLAILLMLAWVQQAPGFMVIHADPIPVCVTMVDVVVVGKITGAEAREVEASSGYGRAKLKFSIFKLEVSEVIKGTKEAFHLRVGLGYTHLDQKLRVGSEGCFFLTKNPEKDFHMLLYGGFLDKSAVKVEERSRQGYEKDVALARRCVKLLADPDAGLKSRDARERFLTAFLLVNDWNLRLLRTSRKDVKPEPVPAEQSKLILQGLAELDLAKAKDPEWKISHHDLYSMKLDKASDKVWRDMFWSPARIQGWLKENADKARVQRLVPVRRK